VSEPILRELRHSCQRHDAELRALVGKAVDAGVRTQDIAEAMGISRATLWRRYGAELQRGEPARP
jgi:transcriptional regulator of acetoin/glycerol metabolism